MSAEAVRRSRQKSRRLEDVRAEVRRLLELMAQPWVRMSIPKADVIEWLERLNRMAGVDEHD